MFETFDGCCRLYVSDVLSALPTLLASLQVNAGHLKRTSPEKWQFLDLPRLPCHQKDNRFHDFNKQRMSPIQGTSLTLYPDDVFFEWPLWRL